MHRLYQIFGEKAIGRPKVQENSESTGEARESEAPGTETARSNSRRRRVRNVQSAKNQIDFAGRSCAGRWHVMPDAACYNYTRSFDSPSMMFVRREYHVIIDTGSEDLDGTPMLR